MVGNVSQGALEIVGKMLFAEGGPTASDIRAANRNAVGGPRKRCRKGKNCSAACIDPSEYCLVGLPEPVSVSTSKVSAMLQQRQAGKKATPVQSPVADQQPKNPVKRIPKVVKAPAREEEQKVPSPPAKSSAKPKTKAKPKETEITKEEVTRLRKIVDDLYDAMKKAEESDNLAEYSALKKQHKKAVVAYNDANGRYNAQERKKQEVSVSPADQYALLKKQLKAQEGIADPSKIEEMKRRLKDLAGEIEKTPEGKATLRKIEDEFVARTKRKAEVLRRAAAYEEGQLNANLTNAQKTAILDYTRDTGERNYATLNRCLRDPKNCSASDKKWVSNHAKELDSALSQLPGNEKGEQFWRGLRVRGEGSSGTYAFLENAKPGTKLKDPGFGSYTFDEDVSDVFASASGGGKNILFVSRNKNLRPVTEFSAGRAEYEAILPRGTEQTIKSVNKVGESLIVELE